MAVVIIDPGHGGTAKVGSSSPNNATSVSGIAEKSITLDIARRIRFSLLHGTAKAYAVSEGKMVEVVLTRQDDSNIGLDDRAAFAAKHDADLFLSLHCNGFPGNPARKVRGSEAYIGRKYRDAVVTVSAGKSTTHEGPGIPSSGLRNINVDADAAFASAMVTAFVETLKKFDAGARYRNAVYTKTASGEAWTPPQGVKMAGLAVLRDAQLGTISSQCKACLLEMEFIDHADVDAVLNGGNAQAVRNALAAALGKAIVDSL